jgi:nitrate reductase / nitrite oxidoreductase, alpha subunit
VRYLTPHNKWSIHSEYQDNLFMLSLSRGGQTIWMSDQDAAKVGVEDNDWIEAVNRNGVVVARAIVSATGCPRARSTCTTRRTGSSTSRSPRPRQARRHPQLADPDPGQAQPPDRRLRPAGLRFNYLGPTGNQRDEVTVIARRSPGGASTDEASWPRWRW